jgi:hypothetical protein
MPMDHEMMNHEMNQGRSYLAEALTEVLPVTDSVRAQAEAEVLIHLNQAIENLGACISLTFHDATFERLISALRECKGLQREIEGQVN